MIDNTVSKVMKLILEETVGNWTKSSLKEYIQLTDVYVDITLDSDNEEVIPDSSGSRVTLQALKPGTATVRIYPTGITDPNVLKVCTIERQVTVVSGTQTEEPYDMGAKVTDVQDSEGNSISSAYIGQQVQLLGSGFSLYPENTTKQRLFYTKPSQGFTAFQQWMLGESNYGSVRFEIPDSMPGDMGVEVKGIAANSWWQSNALLQISPPTLSTKLSSAFVGEGLTIVGNGFSHTPQNNKVVVNDTVIPLLNFINTSNPFSNPGEMGEVTVNRFNHGGYVSSDSDEGEGEGEGETPSGVR